MLGSLELEFFRWLVGKLPVGKIINGDKTLLTIILMTIRLWHGKIYYGNMLWKLVKIAEMIKYLTGSSSDWVVLITGRNFGQKAF